MAVKIERGGVEHATAAKGNGIPGAERKHHDRKRSVLIIVVGSASGQGAGEGDMTAMMEEGRRGRAVTRAYLEAKLWFIEILRGVEWI